MKLITPIIDHFKSTKSFPPRCQILDIGCGHGMYIRKLLSFAHVDVHGIDGSTNMLSQIFPHSRLKLTHADFNECVPLMKSFHFQYHLILLLGLLEFLEDPYEFLESLHLYIKDTGHLVLLYPPSGVGSWPYLIYHFLCNQIKIKLFHPFTVRRLLEEKGWILVQSIRFHPYAQIESYVWRKI